jgi:hypothetical protein
LPREPLTDDDLDGRIIDDVGQVDLTSTAEWFEGLGRIRTRRNYCSRAMLLVIAGDYHWRVREAQGFPMDDFDEMAQEMLAAREEDDVE